MLSESPVYKDTEVTFHWNTSDSNNDELTCYLDINNDGETNYTLSDCANNNSQTHVFNIAGEYSARLVVDDGVLAPVERIIEFRVIPKLSTSVTANGPAVAGERLLYTITIGNATALPMSDINISLTLPAELSFNYANDAQPNSSRCGNNVCTPSEVASWSFESLPAGESRSIHINALVAEATLDGTVIDLPLTIDAAGLNAINTIKSIEVLNSPSADVVLSATTDPVVLGQSFVYHVDFGNTRATALEGAQLNVVLPVGLTVDSISHGGMEVASGIVQWDESDISVGQSRRRAITVTADGELKPGELLHAHAELTYDGITVADSAELALSVVSAPLPLALNMSSSADPVVNEQRVTYSFTVGNTSSQPVDDITVLIRLPSELSFNYSNDAAPDSSRCGNNVCTASEEAWWTYDSLAPGESRTITVNAIIDTVLSGNIINLPIRVTSPNLTDDVVLLKTLAVFNTTSADLALSASADPVAPGETFNYQLDFGNTSAGALSNTELRAHLPDGIVVNSISNGGMEVSPGVVVWSESNVSVGASLHREINVTLDSNAPIGGLLKASAQLTFDGAQAVDNTAEFVSSVTAAALPLAIDLSSSANPVVSNNRVMYTFTLGNISSLPINNVSVMVRLPAELSWNYSGDVAPDSSRCGNNVCTANEEATWAFATLAAGENRSITINAHIDDVLSGNLINLPVRIVSQAFNDDVTLIKTLAVQNSTSADLTISADADPVTANQSYVYQLDFGNTSANALSSAQLRAFLPAGITIQAISDGGIEEAPGTVLWDEENVGVGISAKREIRVTANSNIDEGGILKARAQLVYEGGQAVDNQSEFAGSVVSAPPPISVDITSSANPTGGDSRLVYHFTVSNHSLQPVNNVTVMVRLPEEISFNYSNDAAPNSSRCGNNVCTATEEASWTFATMAAGESQTITVNAHVAETLDGHLINLPVRITTANLKDDIQLIKTVAVYNNSLTDLAISASADPVTPNQTFSYRIDFSNISGSSLSDLVLRAYLPPGISIDAISDSGTEVVSGVVEWSAISLGTGSAAFREVSVTADSVIAGENLTLMAELKHTGGLQIDKRSEYSVSVANSGSIASLLSFDVTATAEPVASGEVLTYTLTITNNYGLPVDNIAVQLRVPDGLSFSYSNDASPPSSRCGNNVCTATEEAVWSFDTLAAGASEVITLNARVAAGITDSHLIVAPFRVSADGMTDSINTQHVTVIKN